MHNFLTRLISCSVSMSVLALVYIAVTPWLSKRYAAKWRYYAWLIIVIGLIVPFRPYIQIAFVQVDLPIFSSSIQKIMSVNAETYTEPDLFAVSAQQGLTTISWYQLAWCLWLLGAIALITYHSIRYRRFLKMVKRWGKEVSEQHSRDIQQCLQAELGISKQIKLLVCPGIESPMMIGFRFPVILLPTINYSVGELIFILKHELIHLKRKDLWYKSLVLLATALHWFNPVIYLVAKEIAHQSEVSCDAEVVQNTNIDERLRYSETLIGVVKNQSKFSIVLSTNFYGGKRDMKNRISSIMDMTKKKMGVCVLCLILIGTFATGLVIAKKTSQWEKSALEQLDKKEIANQYAVYAEYGLNYDQEKNSFYYKGQQVRFFADLLDNNGTYKSFTRPNGVIDLKAMRNKKNELTGIAVVSQEEYDQRTASIKRAQATLKTGEKAQENNYGNQTSKLASAVETVGNNNSVNCMLSTAFSEGDPNYVDNSLSAYLSYGIFFDEANQQWVFKNKPIYFLSDGKILTFVNYRENAETNGISLKVIRKANGQIEKIIEINNQEVAEFFN